MKRPIVAGSFTKRKKRPASLFLPEIARAALNYFIECADPKYQWVPYVEVGWYEDPPRFKHHRWDWVEVLPYSIIGEISCRYMTGDEYGLDVQMGQLQLLLRAFDNLDGFAYPFKSAWNDRTTGFGWNNPQHLGLDLWEQALTFKALLAWYLEGNEKGVLRYIEDMVHGLWEISKQEGNKRTFPRDLDKSCGMEDCSPGILIEPLTKYHELTRNKKAIEIAKGLTYMVLEERFNPDGSWDGFKAFYGQPFFRAAVSNISGISRYATFSRDPELLRRAKKIHDNAAALCTSFGSNPNPCGEPGCSDMDMIESAFSLIRCGCDEYWDQIDRFVRNALLECQFLDPREYPKDKAKKVEERQPYDDYRDVITRCIGGFCRSDPDERTNMMNCCAGYAMWTLFKVWNNIVTKDNDGIKVNFAFNFENQIAEVISYEPFQGRISVIPRENLPLAIRIPEYALKSRLEGYRNGNSCDIEKIGRYAYFECLAQPSVEYSLIFPLRKETTTEKKYKIFSESNEEGKIVNKNRVEKEFKVGWRGNTVIEIEPKSKSAAAIYKRQNIDTDEVLWKEVSYFIPEKTFQW